MYEDVVSEFDYENGNYDEKKDPYNLFPFKIASRVPAREPSILQRAMKIAAL